MPNHNKEINQTPNLPLQSQKPFLFISMHNSLKSTRH